MESRVILKPNPKILNAYLDEYLVDRSVEWDSFKGIIKRYFNDVTEDRKKIIDGFKSKFDLANNPSEEDILNIEKKLGDTKFKTLLESALTEEERKSDIKRRELAEAIVIVNNWIRIIFELGIEARAAQTTRKLPYLLTFLPQAIQDTLLSWLNYHDSRFFRTLHAIRTLIIRILKKNPLFETIYDHKINSLVENIEALKDKIRKTEKNPNEENESTLEIHVENQKTLLLQLADLGHLDSIFDAKSKGYFGDIQFPTREYKQQYPKLEINIKVPCCYQPDYFYLFHEDVIRPHTRYNFKTFIENAIKTLVVASATVENVENIDDSLFFLEWHPEAHDEDGLGIFGDEKMLGKNSEDDKEDDDSFEHLSADKDPTEKLAVKDNEVDETGKVTENETGKAKPDESTDQKAADSAKTTEVQHSAPVPPEVVPDHLFSTSEPPSKPQPAAVASAQAKKEKSTASNQKGRGFTFFGDKNAKNPDPRSKDAKVKPSATPRPGKNSET